MAEFTNPGLLLAFGAGVLSFLSPCCLPIYPAYLSYLSGVSVAAGGGRRAVRRRVMTHAVLFVLGFSIIWIALGQTASLLSQFFINYKLWLARIGGGLVIVLGLILLRVMHVPFLMREYRVHMAQRPAGYLGSVWVGMGFAAGWTPCIGPILSAVVILAASRPGEGALLLLAYSLGFAVPFLVLAYTMGSTQWLLRYSGTVERIGGGLMVVMGLLLVSGRLSVLLGWLTQLLGGFQGF